MRILAWLLLGLAGCLSFLVERGALGRPVPPDLELVSAELGGLASRGAIDFPPSALGEYPPERSIFRRYADDAGRHGVLYVAYYLRGKRWSGRPHPVEVCFATDGWEELDSRLLRTPAGAGVWSRRLEREGRTIHLVHWFQRPGEVPAMGFWSSLWERLRLGNDLRQDMVSAYFEFDAAARPSDEVLLAAADAVIADVDRLWK